MIEFLMGAWLMVLGFCLMLTPRISLHIEAHIRARASYGAVLDESYPVDAPPAPPSIEAELQKLRVVN